MEEIRSLGTSAVVAFSGGVDSTLILRAAADALGPGQVLAATVRSTLHCTGETAEAERIALRLGVEWQPVDLDPLILPEVRGNTKLRCYFCKRYLFGEIKALCAARGFQAVLDGSNADDLGGYRPGARAARELEIHSPLQSAGFTKADVRAALRALQMPEAGKPANSCLATRIPYDVPLDPELLKRIDRAERALRARGYTVCRVRIHGDLARIEVQAHLIGRLAADREAVESIREILNLPYLTLDLLGYRSGCYDAGLAEAGGDGETE